MRRRFGSWPDHPRPFTIDVQTACDQVKLLVLDRWSAFCAFDDPAAQ
jgi:hypothetical protein